MYSADKQILFHSFQLTWQIFDNSSLEAKQSCNISHAHMPLTRNSIFASLCNRFVFCTVSVTAQQQHMSQHKIA